jgi:hypothetical protein
MIRLVTLGNMAALEYEPTQNVEEFHFDKKDGTLFISGYIDEAFSRVFGKEISCAKRHKLPQLIGYTILGRHHEAEKKVGNDFSKLSNEVNIKNAVFFIKKQ